MTDDTPPYCCTAAVLVVDGWCIRVVRDIILDMKEVLQQYTAVHEINGDGMEATGVLYTAAVEQALLSDVTDFN